MTLRPRSGTQKIAYSSTRAEVVFTRALGIDDNTHHVPQVAAEHVFQEHSEVEDLMLIDRNDKDAVRLEKSTREDQSPSHHRQPFAVAPRVGLVHIVVVIFRITGSSVVGRVDVNAVHSPRVEPIHELQGMMIVSLDENVVWRSSSSGNRFNRVQRRKYWFPEPLGSTG
jgi:hypothetical protein